MRREYFFSHDRDQGMKRRHLPGSRCMAVVIATLCAVARAEERAPSELSAAGAPDSRAAESTGTAPGPSPGVQASAVKLLEEGNELYRRGDFVGALAHFQGAVRLVSSPRVKFNVALTLRQLARPDESLMIFEQIASDPSAPPEVAALASEQVAELLPTVGKLQLAISPALVGPGELAIDDRPPAAIPRGGESLPLREGSHNISVTIPGFLVFRAQAEIRPGDQQILRVNLERRPIMALPPAAPPARRSYLPYWIAGGALALAGGALATYFILRCPSGDDCTSVTVRQH